MAPVAAYHSARQRDRKVYHNTTQCADGKSIESADLRAGTGGLPLCKECVDSEMDDSRSIADGYFAEGL
jgi:hypothetical protein